MTLPAVMQIFFAVDLPPTTKKAVGHFISMLKKKSKSNAIRWTKPQNLHITLQFLAEIQTAHLDLLLQKVHAAIQKVKKKSKISLGKVHLFPHPYRPRVIVLEVMPQTELAMLSQAIGDSIKYLNYKVESRPFRGHLTLGRIKHAQSVNLHFLTECAQPEIEEIEVNEVVLFRSEPQPEGSTYSALKRITLL